MEHAEERTQIVEYKVDRELVGVAPSTIDIADHASQIEQTGELQ
jgi:hypothetical protein